MRLLIKKTKKVTVAVLIIASTIRWKLRERSFRKDLVGKIVQDIKGTLKDPSSKPVVIAFLRTEVAEMAEPVLGKKETEKVWQKVRQFSLPLSQLSSLFYCNYYFFGPQILSEIRNDARIRETTEEIDGEDKAVWRWIGK